VTVPVAGVEGMTHSYISDTLCGLLECLDREKVQPSEATILEIRPEGEFPVLLEHCTGPDGKWLRRPARPPRPVDPATDLHAEPEVAGTGTGRKGGRPSRSDLPTTD
jgi:hypothetical protein